VVALHFFADTIFLMTRGSVGFLRSGWGKTHGMSLTQHMSDPWHVRDLSGYLLEFSNFEHIFLLHVVAGHVIVLMAGVRLLLLAARLKRVCISDFGKQSRGLLHQATRMKRPFILGLSFIEGLPRVRLLAGLAR